MKRILYFFVAALLLAGLAVYALGQTVVTSAYIGNYSISEDGSELRFSVGVGSSMGYVRSYKDEHSGNEHYLRFYYAWGGFNSRWGAKSEYFLPLSPTDTAIYVKHSKGYQLALEKDAEGVWVRGE